MEREKKVRWQQKKPLSCQNSMSLYLKRELVIGRESGGEGDRRQEGTEAKVLQLLKYAARVASRPRRGEASSAAEEPRFGGAVLKRY